MSYMVVPTQKFLDDLDYYEHKMKYRNIENDLQDTIDEIKNGNFVGTPIPNTKLPDGEDVFKVRVANSNTKVGKSNGYRLLYYAIKNDKIVYLLAVYYKKNEKRIPTDEEIANIINEYCT